MRLIAMAALALAIAPSLAQGVNVVKAYPDKGAPHAAAPLTTQSTPFLRLEFTPAHMAYAPRGGLLAFTDPRGQGLYAMALADRKVYRVTEDKVGAAFFWAPDGKRLFYRALLRPTPQEVASDLASYDVALRKSVPLARLPNVSGFLTFDPRDFRLAVLHEKGVMTKKLVYPEERLARWQMAQRTDKGRFVAAQGGILWLSNGGLTMRRMADDGSPVVSFDLSPDGLRMAWATAREWVYVSDQGQTPRRVGRGTDPRWHPTKTWLAYAAARMVGDKVVQHDVRVVDAVGAGRYLTLTQGSDERWPTWLSETELLYAVQGTTDVHKAVLQ